MCQLNRRLCAPNRAARFNNVLPAVGIALIVLFLIVLILGLLVLTYWWWEWRGMKGLSPIARAYARLERYLGLIGIHLRPEQTPDERRRTIIQGLPSAEPSVTAITRMYINERYGPNRTAFDLGNAARTGRRSRLDGCARQHLAALPAPCFYALARRK